jgi:mono/diheme cytochrome c family protein
MRHMIMRTAWGPLAYGGLLAVFTTFGCTADKVVSPPREAGVELGGTSGHIIPDDAALGGGGATGKTAPSDAADLGDAAPNPFAQCTGKTGDALIACGEYIVKHIDACGDCHSPIDKTTGRPSQNPALFLTGNPSVVDLDPADDQVGNIPAPNLTLLVKNGWSAKDLRSAILDGARSAAHGGGAFPIMPYATLHNMARVDADAIVAYLMSLPPSGHAMAGRDDLPAGIDPSTLPIKPFDASQIPDPPVGLQHRDDALRGKYLAAELGLCMDCHTPRDATMQLDASKLFAGGETFALPQPFGTVTALNITPATNGIHTWDAENVKNLILTGLDDKGVAICPPMPAGPDGAFGGITPNDALAIGYYITSLPSVVNPPDGSSFTRCVPPAPPPPPPPPTDAGVKPGVPDAAVIRPDASIP